MSLEPLSKLKLIEMAQNDPRRYNRLMHDFDASSPTEFQETLINDLENSRALSDYIAYKKAMIRMHGDAIKTQLPTFEQYCNPPEES